MAIYRRKVRGKRISTFDAKFVFNGKLHRRGGFPDKDSAQHWVDTTRAQLRRGELGYVKARNSMKIIPLIEEFAESITGLRRSDKYAENTEYRLLKIAREAPWVTLGDMTGASLESWRASKPRWKKKVLKAKTLNQYLDHASNFADWLVKPKMLIPVNPFDKTGKMTALPNEGYRRAASIDELNKLLASSPEHRRVVYQFLIYIPLRRRALERIVWRDLDLTGERPTFTLRAELAKNGRACKLAVRKDLAESLVKYKGDAEPGDRVFVSVPSIRELKRDLRAAGISFDDGTGKRRFDLHSFRKTVTRLLKQSGVPLDEAHIFLQHRDRRTTEKFYDDDLVAPEISSAAEKMPAIGLGAQSDAQNAKSAETAVK